MPGLDTRVLDSLPVPEESPQLVRKKTAPPSKACSEMVYGICKIKENRIQTDISEENRASVRTALQQEVKFNSQTCFQSVGGFSAAGALKEKKNWIKKGLSCEHVNKQVLLHLDVEHSSLGNWHVKIQLKCRTTPCLWFVFHSKVRGVEVSWDSSALSLFLFLP